MQDCVHWAMTQRLITMEQVQRWQMASPQADTLSLLIKYCDEIDSNAWLDAVIQVSSVQWVMPFAAYPESQSAQWDPFEKLGNTADMTSVSLLFVPPHAWLNAQCSPEILLTAMQLFTSDGKGMAMKVPMYRLQQARPIEGLHGVYLLYQTALNVWVVTKNDWTPVLIGRILQITQRRVHLLLALESWEPGDVEVASLGPSVCLSPQLANWNASNHPNQSVDNLLDAAIERGASDIHLDTKSDKLRIRFRIHGSLFEQPPMALSCTEAIFRRLKIMAGMNPQWYGKIQDGAMIRQRDSVSYHLRVAMTINTDQKESAVVRLFEPDVRPLSEIRLGSAVDQALQQWLLRDSGLLLISGPTGSGKTSTLHAILMHLISTQNLLGITLENPVERRLFGIRQIEVGGPDQPSFEEAMRSVLRQDPDVLLIGEIRDVASAQAAIQATLSGHRVLASIHSGSAAGVIDRLRGSFQIDPVALAGSLDCSIAQRLVPRLCEHCKRPRSLSITEKQMWLRVVHLSQVFEGVGCEHCHGTGKSGRLIIAEVLGMDDQLEALILKGASIREIRTQCQNPIDTIQGAALALLERGEIDLQTMIGQIRKEFSL